MQYDLTRGSIAGSLIKFTVPLMLGNLLQQFYNIADTLIVGRFLGADALAAVGSTYTLMIFLISVILGLCMGASAFFSIQFGKRDWKRLRQGIFLSFCLIGLIALILNLSVYAGLDGLLVLLKVPVKLQAMMMEYMVWVFAGIMAVFLYNFYANLLRAMGNAVIPLYFLGASAVLNILLDLLFIIVWHQGVRGAAIATVLSQYVSGIGIALYYERKKHLLIASGPEPSPEKKQYRKWDSGIVGEIASLSVLTCLQQSIMNFGILMVQGLVNSFGTSVMAAFAAAVKIDTFAYSPVQDFGNAFSTFVAQNYGAGKRDRIIQGMKHVTVAVLIFCAVVSTLVCVFAVPLMTLFISPQETEIIAYGIQYLRIEAAFYFGIGILFLLYGFYRAVKRPAMSVVLTVISLGTRVLLAYILSANPAIGVNGIWAAIPIGWILADVTGILLLFRMRFFGQKPVAVSPEKG